MNCRRNGNGSHWRLSATNARGSPDRQRIAQFIAHCVSVMVVQAGAGQRLPRTDNDGTVAALGAIAEAASQARTEIGRLAGLLGGVPCPGTRAGLDRIGELVRRAHLAGLAVDCRFLGDACDRLTPAVSEHAEANADMYATAEESREQIVGLYRRACGHADETIKTLGLEATGQVPWWPPEQREVTLHRILVHVLAETSRHAGHAGIVRELIDGAAGFAPGDDNLADGDPAWWDSYRGQVERAAQPASRG
jgi:hypothetical protein